MISINSLSPSKNQDNVSIDADIELEIVSTSGDLDISSLQFFINEISIEPSAYYGVDNTSIDLVFYSRKRIKYNSRRYGQDDFRYGQTDIFPSNFQYGSRYVCKIIVQNDNGDSLEESFSFHTEEGIFFNSINDKKYYAQQSQAFANYLPEESKGRYDKYSFFQQMINPSCLFNDEINGSLYKQIANYFVQTSDMTDLSRLYKVELGGDFIFSSTILDNGEILRLSPEVVAQKDITKYHPSTEFNNRLKDFYYKSLPTRLDESKTTLSSFEIYPKTKISPVSFSIEETLEREGSFCLRIEEGTVFTRQRKNLLDIMTCRIKGVSRENKQQEENIVIIDNDAHYSLKLWKRIDSVLFLNIPEENNASFSIFYSRPKNWYRLDSFTTIGIEDLEKPVFWRKAQNDLGSVLQQHALLESDIDSIISTLAQKDLVAEYQLLDIDNSTELDLIDIDTQPFAELMYGVDDEYLYIFDKKEEYSDVLKLLPKDNGVANFVIDLISDNFIDDDGAKYVSFVGIQKDIGKQIVQYRFRIRKPDDTYDFINESNQIITESEAAIVADVLTPQITTKTIRYQLTMPGSYIIFLETIYSDGSSSVDAKIVRISQKAALAKYKLGRLLREASIEHLFFDFDHVLKIHDSNNELHSLRLVKDNMLIDYDNSVLMFNEDYDEIEVLDG